MSRAFHPPDSLSREDIQTLNNVRRDIWVEAMKGWGIGTLTGFTLYSIASIGQHRFKLWKLPKNMLNRNMAFLSVLLGGAMGSFLMSVTTGKNQVHLLHPIFALGAKPAENDREDETISTHLSLKELSILQQQQQHQQQHHQQQQQQYDHSANTTTTAASAAGSIIDRSQMERNRLYRRASLTKRMEVPGNRSHDSRPPASSTTTATTATGIEVDGRLLSDHEVTQQQQQQQQARHDK